MTKEILSQEPLATEKIKKRNNRKFLTTIALTTAIALSAMEADNIINNQQAEPGNGVENPFPTISRPTSKPVEISPLTPIEFVPLISEGNIRVTYFDNKSNDYSIHVENATVVAIEKDKYGQITNFAVTTAGDKINKTCNNIDLNGKKTLACDFSGATLWFSLTNNTVVTETVNENLSIVGQGPNTLSKTGIRLGNVINYIGIGTGYVEGSNFTAPETAQKNLESLNNLNAKVGEKLLRADKSFSFVAGNIGV